MAQFAHRPQIPSSAFVPLCPVVSPLLTPIVSRPPLPERGHMPNPPAAMFPSPPGGEGSCSADPTGWSTFSAMPCRTPCHFYPSWAESGLAVLDAIAALPAIPSLAPRGSTPPLNGRVVGAGLLAGSPSKRLQLVLQCLPVSISPSWADVVRSGTSLSPSSPATTAATTTAATADFLALYERCVSNGLKACINISNNTGHQEISLTCQVPAATTSAQRRRLRRPRQHGLVASAAVPLPSRAPQIRPEPPPAEPPPPQPSPPEMPPPVKRTRKAAKRHCKVELLRGGDGDHELCLSPPPLLSPPPRSPPSRVDATSMNDM